jgi:hypothetical protein
MGLKITMKFLSQDNLFPGRYFNPDPPKHGIGVLTTRLPCSVLLPSLLKRTDLICISQYRQLIVRSVICLLYDDLSLSVRITMLNFIQFCVSVIARISHR